MACLESLDYLTVVHMARITCLNLSFGFPFEYRLNKWATNVESIQLSGTRVHPVLYPMYRDAHTVFQLINCPANLSDLIVQAII